MIDNDTINKFIPGLMPTNEEAEYFIAECSLLPDYYSESPIFVLTWDAYREQTIDRITMDEFKALHLNTPNHEIATRIKYENYMTSVIGQLIEMYLGEEHGNSFTIKLYAQARAELLKATRIKSDARSIAYLFTYVESMGVSDELQRLRKAVFTNVFNIYMSRLSDGDYATSFIDYEYFERFDD